VKSANETGSITNKMDTCFYSLLDIVGTPNTRTPSERLWNSLRTLEPELEDFTPLKNLPPQARDILETDLMFKGMYCLKVNGKIVSVAIIKKNTIDRIITIPKFRARGYARLLIDIVTDRMKENGVPFVFSPVKPEVFGLFERIGWVRCGTGARDGTFDYCPAEDLDQYGTGGAVEFDGYRWYSHLTQQQPVQVQ